MHRWARVLLLARRGIRSITGPLAPLRTAASGETGVMMSRPGVKQHTLAGMARPALRIAGLVTVLVAVLALLAACGSPRDAQVVFSGPIMGTQYQVKVLDNGRVDAAALQARVETRLDAINASMSTWLPDSELSRLNAAPAGAPVTASDDLFAVLQGARRIHADSGGAFDVTVGPLVNLWGFGPGNGTGDGARAVPAADALAAARDAVGMQRITLDTAAQTVTRAHPESYIDLSAIAKGYAVDEVARLVGAHEPAGYLVEIGGEVKVHGVNAEGGPWRIGIEKPLPGQRSVARALALSDTGLATSGDYRNFFELDGVRYSHTIDPRSGAPVRHELASVSVLHESTMLADAIATAMMVLGPAAGMETADRRGWAVLMLLPDGDGFRELASKAFSAQQDGG